MPTHDELKKARSFAFKLLSYKDRTRQEIAGRLLQKGFSSSIIQKTLDGLTSLHYLDDKRFALDWGRSRIETKKVAKRKLWQELSAKGLEPEIIGQTLDILYSEIDETMLAKRCAQKKLSLLKGLGLEIQKRRLAQFLYRKGYPSDIIFQTVNELIPRSGDEAPSPLGRRHPVQDGGKSFTSCDPD
ncbi:MAG: regulatory protein RecX [Nitrospinaceae bacterium]